MEYRTPKHRDSGGEMGVVQISVINLETKIRPDHLRRAIWEWWHENPRGVVRICG